MSSATERLREMLDERGADYRVSATGYSIDIGPYTTAYANRSDTTLDVSLRQVTPEQAVAATLGAVEYRKPTTLSQLEAENAKLRELVRDMMVAWWACDNERCPRHDKRCEEGKFCAFDECARDLGIEVDE